MMFGFGLSVLTLAIHVYIVAAQGSQADDIGALPICAVSRSAILIQ
jgi:hypothetical protein